MESVVNLRHLANQWADKSLLKSFFLNNIRINSGSPGLVLKNMNSVYSDESSTVSYNYLESFDENNYASTQEQNCVIEIHSSAHISVFEYDSAEKNTILITPKSSRSYRNGDQVELIKGAIYKIKVHKPGLVVMATNNDMNVTRSTYCTQSGKLISTCAINNQHSKLQFAAQLLGMFKNPKSKKVLSNMTRHPVYFVRWQAAQSYSLLAEREEIIEMLNIMKSDENEMISNAAKSSLQRISN